MDKERRNTASHDEIPPAEMNPVIVSVSGGLSSVEAWERTLLKYEGKRKVIAVFADVGSVVENGRVVCGEDEDLLRFLAEVEIWMGLKVERIKHPKYNNIWDVFFGERFLISPWVDPCSKYLKRETLKTWVAQFERVTWVLGFSWTELHRVTEFKQYSPNSEFPLTEKPYLLNEDIAAKWERRGIKRARAYAEGFSHDNCGGMCVKMGLGQAFDLWKLRLHRFEYAERREKQFRAEVNSEVTIFQKSGERITMQELRSLFENGYVPKTANSGEACGGRCMLPSKHVSTNLDDY